MYSAEESHMIIGNQKIEHIDKSNILHVARLSSNIVQNRIGIVGMFDIGCLLKTIVQYGTKDTTRSPDSYRLHFAAAGI